MNGIDFNMESEALFVDVMDKYVVWRLKDIMEAEEDFDGELAEVKSACETLIDFME
jgi:hypothetical protein